MNSGNRTKGLLLGVLIAAICFAVPMIVVWKKAAILEQVRTNEELKLEEKKLQNENLAYRYQLELLKSRGRIEKIAEDELGLKYPDNAGVTVVLRENGVTEDRKFLAGLFSGR